MGVWYGAYSLGRLLANPSLSQAQRHTRTIVTIEHDLHVNIELTANHFLARHDVLALAASYWYATAYYIVTVAVLVWLFRRHPDVYTRARNALILVTLVALCFYLTLPTAPPRLQGSGFHDILAGVSSHGWRSAGSVPPQAPQSGQNDLAAFPSMHAGWGAWVALALHDARATRGWQAFGYAYAVTSVLVIISTANHWVLDAAGGIAMMWAGYRCAIRWTPTKR